MNSPDSLDPRQLFRRVVPDRFLRELCEQQGFGLREGVFSAGVVICQIISQITTPALKTPSRSPKPCCSQSSRRNLSGTTRRKSCRGSRESGEFISRTYPSSGFSATPELPNTPPPDSA